VSFTDSLVGSATADTTCNTLGNLGSCTFTYPYTVAAGDPNSLLNTATVHYNPAGFPNDITSQDTATVTVLHPSFTIDKECTTTNVPQGGTATFKVTITNTGDADLVVDPDEGASATYAVAAGKSTTFNVDVAAGTGATVGKILSATLDNARDESEALVVTGYATNAAAERDEPIQVSVNPSPVSTTAQVSVSYAIVR